LQTAAQKMRDHDIGILPVCDSDRLIGMLSDRDIIIRATAVGIEPNAKVGRELATAPVIYCYDDQDVDEAAQLMQSNQIRRLPILRRKDKRLVGIIALSDVALNIDDRTSGHVLQSVSEPDGIV
jgi:CBS domain-containing protein